LTIECHPELLEIPEKMTDDAQARRRSRVMAKPEPEKKPAASAASTTRVLPTKLQLGDRLTDETGEYEVVGRPYTTAGGKTANVRVKRGDSGAEMFRVWGAHERVAARRG
jgi:hypothetical protein